MKNLLTSILLFVSIYSYSQNTFEKKYSETTAVNYSINGGLLDNGNNEYVFVTNEGLVNKVDQTGAVIWTLRPRVASGADAFYPANSMYGRNICHLKGTNNPNKYILLGDEQGTNQISYAVIDDNGATANITQVKKNVISANFILSSGVLALDDGGFILYGIKYSQMIIAGDQPIILNEAFAIRFDAAQNIIWNKLYSLNAPALSGSYFSFFKDVIQTQDRNLAFTGAHSAATASKGTGKGFLVKINFNNGNILQFSDLASDISPKGLVQLDDSKIVISAQNFQFTGQPVLMFFDNNLNFIHAYHYTEPQGNFLFFGDMQIKDNTLYITGTDEDDLANANLNAVYKIDPITKNIIVARVFTREEGISNFKPIEITSDDHLLFLNQDGINYYNLVKTDLNLIGNVCNKPLCKVEAELSEAFPSKEPKAQINLVLPFINEPFIVNGTVESEDECCSFNIPVTGTTVVCEGSVQSFSLCAPEGYEQYYWNNCEETQCIGIPPVPGDYVVNVIDANGCVGTGTVSVTNPDWNSMFISGATNKCASPQTFSINAPAGYSVNWNVPDAVSFTGQGSTTISNVNWGATVDETSTVSATVGINGCFHTFTFQVVQCCADPLAFPYATSPNAPTNFSTLTATWGANPSGISTWVFNDLIIDQNTTFTNVDMRMAPGYSIIVLPGISFNLKDCNLHAMCDEMWKGVYVNDPTALVSADNTTFREAENAITSENGGNYSLVNSKFIDNHIGLSVKNYNSAAHTGTVTGTSFRTNTPLIAPYLGQQALYGIEVFDVGSITFGDAALPANIFRNLEYGINITDATVTAVNNDFRYIQHNVSTPVCNSCHCTPGAAVCDYTTIKNSNYILYAGGTGNARNEIKNSGTGITIIGSIASFIKNNDFRYIIFGIDIYFAQNRLHVIEDNNEFRNFNVGIFAFDNAGAELQIRNNYFNTGLGFGISNTAIAIHNPIKYYMKTLIEDNDILRIRNGIWFRNVSAFGGLPLTYDVNVNNNLIYFQQLGGQVSGNVHYGIRIEECDFIYVHDNTITKPGAIPNNSSVGFLRGVSTNNSNNTILISNDFTRMAEGVWAYGDCSNSIFGCNSFDQTYQGFKFSGPGGSADVDDQLPGYEPTDNTWANQPAGGFSLNGAISPAIHWWYNGGGILFPTSNLAAGSTLDPSTNTQGEDTSVINTICSSFPAFAPPIERENRIGAIARNEKLFLNNPSEFRQSNMLFGYRSLKDNPSWLNLGQSDDTTFTCFYNQCNNSCIGKFLKVENLIQHDSIDSAFVLNQSIAPNNLFEYNFQRVNAIYLFSRLNDTLINTSDSTELENIAWMNSTIGGPGVMQARSILKLDIEDLENGETRNAINENIIPEELIEIEPDFLIFPNPTDGSFNIQTTEEINCIKIYDMNGKVVYTKFGQQSKAVFLELELNNGIFIVEIHYKNIVEHKKLVISEKF